MLALPREADTVAMAHAPDVGASEGSSDDVGGTGVLVAGPDMVAVLVGVGVGVAVARGMVVDAGAAVEAVDGGPADGKANASVLQNVHPVDAQQIEGVAQNEPQRHVTIPHSEC